MRTFEKVFLQKERIKIFFENILSYLIYLSNESQDVQKKIMFVTEIFKIILAKYILIRIIVITIVNHRNSSCMFFFCVILHCFIYLINKLSRQSFLIMMYPIKYVYKNYLRYRIVYFTFHYISKHYFHYFISRVSTFVPER